MCCRGWCELCCGRGCGFCLGPFRRYQEAFSAGRYIPTLQVSNYMNHEAIVQVPSPGLLARRCLLAHDTNLQSFELGLGRHSSSSLLSSNQINIVHGIVIAVQITDIPEEDIVFVRFEADVISKPCLPYFIALDRQTSTVGTQQV